MSPGVTRDFLPASAATRAPRYSGDEENDDAPRPFLKWAGGKWLLAPTLAALMPPDLERRTYREPFLGGGGLFFWLSANRPPKKVVLSDALRDLVHTYEAVRDKLAPLVAELERLNETHDSDQFYRVRDDFNAKAGSKVQRAAWLIYLNKTCYNGLFRTNRAGLFNVPVGRFVKPRIVHPERLASCSRALKGVEIAAQTFDHLDDEARKGDVIYFDPPYVPVSSTANFAAYSLGAFGMDSQERLAAMFRKLHARGCRLILSNSDTPEVRSLYKGFKLTEIDVRRNISAVGSKRGTASELVVTNAASW
jgi:DNA adenine methylase